MLIFNMQRIFTLRGIDRPFTFLVKKGFPTSTASGMLKYYPVNIKIKSLEKICLALKCTPNDLFEWRDGKDETLDEDQPLNSLRRQAVGAKLKDILEDIPLEKMSELEDYMKSLKEK